MLSLLENWPAIAGRVRAAKSVHLFTDFDGTLTPLRQRPEEVELDPATRLALLRLGRNPRVRVCVISGRRLDDLRCCLDAPEIECRGVHGWEAEESQRLSPAAADHLTEARRELAVRLNGTAGVRIENKDVSFALHYRGADAPAIAQAGALLQDVLVHSGGALRAVPGSCVWEVLPREIRGKGYTVRRQFHRRAGLEALPVYLGNDESDETAFEELAWGVTVRVGPPRPTHARYFLRRPKEVCRFLEKLGELTEALCGAGNGDF